MSSQGSLAETLERTLGRKQARRMRGQLLGRSHLLPGFIIVGAARSGTTFLGDCIGRLPEVTYHHEPPATKAAGRYVYQGLWGERRSREFFRLVYRWLVRVERDGDLRFAEKTPTNIFSPNALHTGASAASVQPALFAGDCAATYNSSVLSNRWLLRLFIRGNMLLLVTNMLATNI